MVTVVANQGGASKTTAANIGALLARRGGRVRAPRFKMHLAVGRRQLGLDARSLGVNLVDVLAGEQAQPTRSCEACTAST